MLDDFSFKLNYKKHLGNLSAIKEKQGRYKLKEKQSTEKYMDQNRQYTENTKGFIKGNQEQKLTKENNKILTSLLEIDSGKNLFTFTDNSASPVTYMAGGFASPKVKGASHLRHSVQPKRLLHFPNGKVIERFRPKVTLYETNRRNEAVKI